MNRISKSIFLIALSLSFIYTAFSHNNNQEENILAQMNYCITSLTNIIHNKSMHVLEHESNQLLNNLTIEQIIGLYEINDFRLELLDAVSRFEITEEERSLLRRLQSIKKDNLKWNALSNALNPTLLLTGGTPPKMGPQLAFQVLLTATRSVVEYNTIGNEQKMEELSAMWDLRKEDLKTISETRRTALNIIFNLYNKYHLSEDGRLTEASASLFSTITSESDAIKRIRLLEDNRKLYYKMAPFYYHLGMAYVDAGVYQKAKVNFDKYLELYAKAPILRYDEMSGCIALTKLIYEEKLSPLDKMKLIDMSLTNLPGNSTAVLQCAMVYLYDLRDEKKGLQLIRAGLDDPNASDKNILFLAASQFYPILAKHPSILSEITSSFEIEKNINLESYLSFLANSDENAWSEISKTLSFNNVNKRKLSRFFIGKHLNKKLNITLPERINFNVDDIAIYVEQHSEKTVLIEELRTYYANGVTLKQIEKTECFKNNKNLKYLFVDALIPNELFILKNNLDLMKIKNQEWPRMSEFILSNSDIKDISKFIKKNLSKTSSTKLKCKGIAGKYEYIKDSNGTKVSFKGDSLRYEPFHSLNQHGYYLRMVINNDVNLIYNFDSKNNALQPYFYSVKDKLVFLTQEQSIDYNEILKIESEPSWWLRKWDNVKSTFSKKDKAENVDKSQIDTEKTSWWIKKWEYIKSIFSKKNKANKP